MIPPETTHGITWARNEDGSWESSDWRFTIFASDGLVTVRDMADASPWTEHESMDDAIAYIERVCEDTITTMRGVTS